MSTPLFRKEFWTNEGGALLFLMIQMIKTKHVWTDVLARVSRATARATALAFSTLQTTDDTNTFDSGLICQTLVPTDYGLCRNFCYRDRDDGVSRKDWVHRVYFLTEFHVVESDDWSQWRMKCDCAQCINHHLDRVLCMFTSSEVRILWHIDCRQRLESGLELPNNMPTVFGDGIGEHVRIESYHMRELYEYAYAFQGHLSCVFTVCCHGFDPKNVQQKRYLYRTALNYLYVYAKNLDDW